MDKSEFLKDHKIYERIENFGCLVKHDSELGPIFADQLERMQRLAELPLKIAVMGEFKSGKSLFVNFNKET